MQVSVQSKTEKIYIAIMIKTKLTEKNIMHFTTQSNTEVTEKLKYMLPYRVKLGDKYSLKYMLPNR